MSVKFGFFDSVETNGVQDRVYSSVDFNEYFKGFMGYYYGANNTNPQYGCGRFANVGQQLKVYPISGLTVGIGSGKALVDYHWYEQDAAETITFSPNTNPTYNRRDRLVLRSNANLVPKSGTPARTVELAIIEGIPGQNAPLPALNIHESTTQDGVYELLLANVTVRAGATEIKQSDIDQSTSPWIRGMLDQGKSLDILVAEFTARLEAQEKYMNDWLDQKQRAFDTWFYDLSDNLLVGGYIQCYHKLVESVTSSVINLNISGYSYESDDVFIVSYNGLTLTRGYHYNVALSGSIAQLTLVASRVNTQAASDMDITILKTNIAKRKEGTLSSDTGSKYIYTNDIALGSTAYGFKIYNLGNDEHPTMMRSNRNLAKLTGITSQTTNGVTITPLTGANAGRFLLEGSNEGGTDITFSCTVSTKALAYAGEYTISLDGSGDNLADGVHFTISSVNDGTITDIATADVGTPETFLTNEDGDTTFVGDTLMFKITVDSDATEEFSFVISPMLEYGPDVHDFVVHTESEFVYGQDKPTFDDTISYIWAKEDEDASNFQLIYYVLSDGSADDQQY